LKKIITYLVFTATLMGCFVAFAQTKKSTNKPVKKEENQKKDNLNKTDDQDRKQGLWFFKHDARMGEPLYFEYGNYQDDKKTGTWTTLDAQRNLVSTENFYHGVLNGTSQYYERGKLVCIGNYRGLNQTQKYDSIWVTDPISQIDSMVVVPTEMGYTKHGTWRYYDAMTGQLTREEEYQVDNLIFEREYHHISKTDSLQMERKAANFPHNRKKAKPTGKYRSQIN
jgi:hypothetical protein